MRQKFGILLVCACLLLALGGCGNKGPLVQPEEEEKQNKRQSSNY